MIQNRRHFLKNTAPAITAFSIPKWLYITSQEENAEVNIYPSNILGEISPKIFGQFIEFVDNSIDGGIFDENNKLSDKNGFRQDVLSLMQELNPPLLRFPGGTVTKIYHWKDGIGEPNERPICKNLIWGGLTNNHFGTDEYIKYCRKINADPFITVNMSTGTAEEAMDWVAYCNADDGTYWSKQRQKNGSILPHNVKLWGLGNEEGAKEDVGKLQKPEDYIEQVWYYAKLMKLQDPELELVVAGDDEVWNEKILKALHPITDYISFHPYASSLKDQPVSLFESIQNLDNRIIKTIEQIKQLTPKKIENFSKWYRFPPRKEKVKLAIDEWGIWEANGKGRYGLEIDYSWNHALGTASFLNSFIRNADYIKIANWAQSVNVLSAISTDKNHAIKQTVFHALANYRKLSQPFSVKTEVVSPSLPELSSQVHALDVSSTYNPQKKKITIFLVNRSASTMNTTIRIDGKIYKGEFEETSLSAGNINNVNSLQYYTKDIVIQSHEKIKKNNGTISIAPQSIFVMQIDLG